MRLDYGGVQPSGFGVSLVVTELPAASVTVDSNRRPLSSLICKATSRRQQPAALAALVDTLRFENRRK
jgi:hypothetical protein